MIYGAVYIRLFKPVAADSLDICLSGKEICKWTRVLPNLVGPSPLLTASSHSKDSAVEDEDTIRDNDRFVEDSNQPELKTRHVELLGEKVALCSEFSLVQYEDGNAPLGCYAYPFQFLLRQGLPSSFRKKTTMDEIKMSSYNAAVEYKVIAKLHCKSSTSQPSLKTYCEFSLRNDDFVLAKTDKCQKQARAKVSSCCCFPKGEIVLDVELDKILYTSGETIQVRFSIHNKSEVKINFARVKLVRTVALMGRVDGSEDDKLDTQEAFPFEVYNMLKQLDSQDVRKKYDILLPLSCDNEEMLSSTLGHIVKCRYQLEVEIVVPWDADVSVYVPIKVCPGPTENWLEWKPPDWIKNVKVIDANPICRVPRRVLESSQFANIPLPLKGLGYTD